MFLKQWPQHLVIPRAERDRLHRRRAEASPNEFGRKKRLTHEMHAEAARLRLNEHNPLAGNVDRLATSRDPVLTVWEDERIDRPRAALRRAIDEAKFLDQQAARLTPEVARHGCFQLAQENE